jgi:heme/copper-type cytochrome/quinol oxidase subunit 4
MEAVLIIVFGIILMVLLWIIAIKDIVRSSFTQPNNQVLFLLMVIFMPILGTLIYFLIGSSYKSSTPHF